MQNNMRRYSSPTDFYVGERLKLLREKRGLDHHQLSMQMSIPRQKLEAYENGHESLSAPQLEKLSRILCVRVQDFFGENPFMLIEEPLTNDMRKILMNYKCLPPKDQEMLVATSELIVTHHRKFKSQ